MNSGHFYFYLVCRCWLSVSCCPSFLNSNIVECMFKDNLACIRKFIKSDNKIRVIRDVGDVICWECGMLRLWDIRDVEC